MKAVATPVQYRPVADRYYEEAARTVLAISGALFVLVGLVLAIGGYLSPNGSAFHMLAGLSLIVSGALVARRHPAGAATYMIAFVAAVAWSLRNLEDGSTLAQRLMGPLGLLMMIALLMPLLCRWRPRLTIAAFGLVLAGTVAIGVSSLPEGPLASRTAAVTQFFDTMAQPSTTFTNQRNASDARAD